MKNFCLNIIFPIVVTLLFIATSCLDKKCKNMPEQIIGTGEIINALIWYKILDTTTINLINSNSNKDFIITSDSLNIFDLRVSFDNGENFQSIDFSQYSVLGKYAIGKCNVVFNRNVSKNIEKQKYIYKITVNQCGLCGVGNVSMNWVLIPKIEDDFTVEFEVAYKLWNGK